MRLFIDDERDPMAIVRFWGNEEDYVARSSTKAIDILEWWTNSIDGYGSCTLYFDHDLGGGDNTMLVVDWLAEAVFDARVNPEMVNTIVHTQNPVGRDNIKRALQRWNFKPLDLLL